MYTDCGFFGGSGVCSFSLARVSKRAFSLLSTAAGASLEADCDSFEPPKKPRPGTPKNPLLFSEQRATAGESSFPTETDDAHLERPPRTDSPRRWRHPSARWSPRRKKSKKGIVGRRERDGLYILPIIRLSLILRAASAPLLVGRSMGPSMHASKYTLGRAC